VSGQELERREADLLEQALAQVEAEPELVLPGSGEVVDLREPAQVAYGLQALRELKRQLDGLRSLLEALLRLESMRQGTKTLHLGSLEATVSGGDKLEWDVDLLGAGLRKAGCPEERIDELVQIKIKYRVDAGIARQLEAANPRYAAAIAAARRRVPAPWRVSVK
jgi:hypothetical protein